MPTRSALDRVGGGALDINAKRAGPGGTPPPARPASPHRPRGWWCTRAAALWLARRAASGPFQGSGTAATSEPNSSSRKSSRTRLRSYVPFVRAEIELDRRFLANRRQVFCGQRLVKVSRQRLARLGRLDLLQMLAHLLDRPVLRHQRLGRLVADPRHPGDVVGGVADERLVVGDERWVEAIALAHRLDYRRCGGPRSCCIAPG